MRTLTGLAIRNLNHRRLRSVLSAAGVALGVALVFAALSVGKNALDQASTLPTEVFHTRVVAKAGGYLPEAVTTQVQAVAGVKVASPQLSLSGISPANIGLSLTVRGVDLTADAQIRTRMLAEGSLPAEGQIAVPASWAAQFKLKLGDTFTLLLSPIMNQAPVPAAFTLSGLLTQSGGGDLGFSGEALTTLNTLQKAAGLAGKVSLIEVRYQDSAAKDQVSLALQQTLGNRVTLISNDVFNGTAVLSFAINLVLAVGGFTILLTAAYLIFNTFAMTLAERRTEMGRLIALGMTPGQARRGILTEALILGLAGVFAGLIVGGVLTIPVQIVVNNITGTPYKPIPLSPLAAVVATLGGIGITVLSTLPVAAQAARISPLEMIFSQRSSKPPSFRRLTTVGVMLLVVATVGTVLTLIVPIGLTGTILFSTVFAQNLFLLGFLLLVPGLLVSWFSLLRARIGMRWGLLTGLALGNIARNPTRAAATASVLTIVIASTVLMASLGSTLGINQKPIMNRALKFDYIMLPRADVSNAMMAMASGKPFVPADANFDAELNALSNKVHTIAIGFIPATELVLVPGFPGAVVTNIGKYGTLLESRTVGFLGGTDAEILARFKAEPSIIIAAALAQRDNLKIGDYVTLNAPLGKARFRVAAIDDQLFFNYLDFEQAAPLFGNISRYGLLMVLQPGVRASEVDTTLQALADRNKLQLVLGSDYTSAQEGFFESLGASFGMVGLMTMLIAGIGILSLMYTAVMERRRELGVLSAVGGTPGQVRRLMLIEAVILGASGMVPGVLIGILLGTLTGPLQAAYSQSARMNMFSAGAVVAWTPVVISIIAAPLVALIAAWLPARTAVKLNVVDAVRYQ